MKDKKISIIAEAGINHNGSLNIAIRLCKIAKESGADYVKFQIFNVNEQISKFAKTAIYQKKQTNKNNMIEMAKSYALSINDHIKIKKYCKKINIKYLASCFDIESTKFYKKNLNKSEIKIGSGEITNYPLLKFISKRFKKIILSTGMANIKEIKKAVKIINIKRNNITILHCNSMYPTKLENVNLNTIKYLQKIFKIKTGFSDHTTEIETGKIAVACGAQILEKHITFSNNAKGPDHKTSLNPAKFKKYVDEVKKISNVLGFEKKVLHKKEIKMIKFARRGVVAKKNLNKGALINLKNFTFKRPCLGIPCENFDIYKGKKIKRKISYDENLKIKHLK